jgi:hypothetical protein
MVTLLAARPRRRPAARPVAEPLDGRVLLSAAVDPHYGNPAGHVSVASIHPTGPSIGPAESLVNAQAAPFGSRELIVNGSFESGDFTGWTTAIRSLGGTGVPFQPWAVSAAGAGDNFGLAATSPPAGRFDAWNGFDGGGPMEFDLSQDVTLPAGSADLLSWTDRVQWAFAGFGGVATQPRTYDVRVLDPTTGAVLATVSSFSTGTEATNPTGDTGFVSHAVNLSNFAGSTVRLQWHEVVPQDFTGPAQIEIDNVSLMSVAPPPPLTGQLAASSDTGPSSHDNITADASPTFTGTADPGSVIRLFAQTVNQAAPVPIGRTTATSGGTWRLMVGPLAQGVYAITATATDPAGHVTTATLAPSGAQGPLVIATDGPRVESVTIQPREGQVVVTFLTTAGLDPATIVPANFVVTRPHLPSAPPLTVTGLAVSPLSVGGTQTVVVQYNGGQALKSGIYKLTVPSGGVRDLAGNALDGEFVQGHVSGNGVPGGDYQTNLVTNGIVAFNPFPPGPFIFYGFQPKPRGYVSRHHIKLPGHAF